MLNRILLGGLAAAAAGAAMLAISSAPAAAFTLSSTSPVAPIVGAHVDKVWYDRWGRWHPGPGPGYGYGWHHRHCWRGRWGHLHCD